ncbi:O-antigen ligase family protein [Moellerella wisconsensis]|uniref:O-antigen ligase n=1 Tax=Moellerella wisconsensis ATCC 35017 TaxID=1354267 RepID=A0A0N0IBP2_9GAMM|nr:O-antigen ligase family protein [Moellerella wisconsensis]KPD03970.1 O-antigen ligase [Moellerella wisconsensis ATCC 35017]VFS49835.1 O-antigen ligase [Moellerella wisconsensis]
MQINIQRRKVITYKSLLDYFVVFFLYFCLSIFIFNPRYAAEIFTLIGTLSLISLTIKMDFSENKKYFLPAALIGYGIIQLLWAYYYQKDNSEFSGTYRSYKDTGKILIISGLIIINIINANLKKLSKFRQLFLIPAFLLLGYAAYEKIYFSGRLGLSFGQYATATAYFITFFSIFVIASLKNDIIINFIVFVISFYLLILTETRAAIVFYPVIICAFILFKFSNKSKKIKFYLVFFLLIVFSIITLLNKDILIRRMNNIVSDISLYQEKSNSKSSVGARLAMIRIGLNTGYNNLLGQSLEQRDQEIKELVLSQPLFEGGAIYSNVHLHNEIVDNFSLKGWWGVLGYLILMLALFYESYLKKSLDLLLFSISSAVYGMSDMILYGNNMTLSWSLLLIMIIFITELKKEKVE